MTQKETPQKILDKQIVECQTTNQQISELILGQQKESNTLKKAGFAEAISQLESINKKLSQILTELANKAEIQNAAAQKQTYPQSPSLDQGIRWTAYPSGNGSWSFATKRDGTPNPKTQPLVEAILKAGGKLETAFATYKLGGDNNKFISKTPK